MTAPPPRIAAVAAETEPAQAALGELRMLYPCVEPERAEVIVSLGGDDSDPRWRIAHPPVTLI